MTLVPLPLLADASNIEVGTHRTLTVAGLTFNVDTIWATALAGIIVVGAGFFVRRRITSGVPNRVQLLWETVVGAIQNQVETGIGPTGARIVPLAVTLFFFILICNWLGLVPTGGVHNNIPAPTGDVNLTYAMAFFVIGLVHFYSIRNRGFRGYVNKYFQPSWLLAPINAIEEVAKPFTLALRLFGNIFAGGLMLILIASLFPLAILWFPNILWKLFDAFIGLIQAFIFSLLTILYFEEALRPAEEGAH